MASWRMVSCAAALRDRYQLCDIYDPLGSNTTISGLCHRQRPNRLQHPQFSGIGMSGDVGKRRGARSHGRGPSGSRSTWSRGAFGAGVRSWQDSAAVRPRAAIRGKFCAPCIPKAASGGKTASSRQDSRAMHPKTGWLWQDMRAMHPKCPANRRWRIHRAKILPGRGAFRCTGPSNHARRADLAIRRRRSALAPASLCRRPAPNRPSARNPGAALMAARHPQHSRCQRQPHRKRSHTPTAPRH